jgi:hypothetical protein
MINIASITVSQYLQFYSYWFCTFKIFIFYPLANEVAKGYRNATVRPSVTSL